jgi:hypothetical protein
MSGHFRHERHMGFYESINYNPKAKLTNGLHKEKTCAY